MKKVFCISLLLFSSFAFSQSLNIPSPGSTQERLDDIEDNLRRLQRNQLIELLENTPNQKNSSNKSKFIGPNTLILKDDKILEKNNKETIALSTSTIKALRKNIFLVSVINESKIPQYDETMKKEYFGSVIYFVIDCVNKKSGIATFFTYDKKYEVVNNFDVIPYQYIDFVPFNKTAKNSYLHPAIKYLCN